MSKPVNENYRERAARDPEYRDGLLLEAIDSLACDDASMAVYLIRLCLRPEEATEEDEEEMRSLKEVLQPPLEDTHGQN